MLVGRVLVLNGLVAIMILPEIFPNSSFGGLTEGGGISGGN